MKNSHMPYLFFCNFTVFLAGGALLPLLPLYATGLGGTPTLIGLYLGLIYLAIAIGTMTPGWLAGRVPAKSLFIAAGVVGVPALALHTQATSLWQVVPLTAIVWFCGGVGTALVSVFIGLYGDNQRRGRSFSLMFLARPLGGIIGGLMAGQLVAWQGYPLLFAVLAVFWAGWPLFSPLALKKDVSITVPSPARTAASQTAGQLSQTFYLLLLAAFLSTIVVYVGRLGVSLSMQMLNFSPQAIAATTSVGYVVTIPITLLIGGLSDRLGRRGFLAICYLLAAGGVLVLSIATRFWHFGLVMVLLLLVTSANGSIAAAFATDLLKSNALSRGLSWLNAVTWLGGVAGFAGAGYFTDLLGISTLYLLTAMISALAAIPLVRYSRRPQFFWQKALSGGLLAPKKV